MSCPCSHQSLRNLDTTVYKQRECCDNSDMTVRLVDSPCCCHSHHQYPVQRPFPVCPSFPSYPFPPIDYPTVNPPATEAYPTLSYAYFYNAGAGTAVATGANLPFPSTLYNTDPQGIVNNNGVITLSGGTTGRSYLINYNADGTFTGATISNLVNSAVVPASTRTADGTATIGSDYIVNVPANTTQTFSVNATAGTADITNANMSIVRIA